MGGKTYSLPAGCFLRHGAHSGWLKCLKQFSGIGNMDYTWFNRESWQARTVAAHRAAVNRIMKCYTKTARKRLSLKLVLEIQFYSSYHILIAVECC